jgi:hypothetical protein
MVLVEVDPSDAADPSAHLRAQLDFYRSAVLSKLDGLDDAALDTTVVPSGWTPRQLLAHLVFMERRWFVWGFLAEQVDDPWGDHVDGRWSTDESVAALSERLLAGGRRTSEILRDHPLDEPAAAGGRFPADEPPPTLATIAFHVLQEMARHAGHLDVVRELIDGSTGES